MSFSWRLGRIAGINVFVHWTFVILLGWIALIYYLPHHSVADAVLGVAFIIALFGIVVLHELGHALAARRYGIATRDITLLPIGGVARLERMPEDPKQEIVVALAGPAVNVVLAAILFVVLSLGAGFQDYGAVVQVGGHFLNQLLWVNIVLAGFNLLPAFPMDGGRVLRALLAMRMDYAVATQRAARVGQAMALLFGFIGLLYNPFLIFIALFVWQGAEAEAAFVQMRSALSHIPVANATVRDVRVLSPSDSLEHALEQTLISFQQDFPVVEDGRLVGLLTRNALMSALARHGRDIPVSDAMQREFVTADAREMLDAALLRLNRTSAQSLPVVSDGRLVGLVTPDSVSERVLIQEALRRSVPRGPTASHLPASPNPS
jgi:Zn-dependent protease/predicted transcriptional regulator